MARPYWVVRALPRSARNQEATMIRLTFLLRRRSGLSLDEFQTYWRDRHGPLVTSFSKRLNMLRYIQVHSIEDSLDGRLAGARGEMEPGYDGVAEAWWESEASLVAAFEDPEPGNVLVEDEREFIDLAHSPVWLAYEYPQVNPTPENIVAREKSPIVKLYFPLRPPSGLKVEDAQLYWRTSHGPIIRSQAAASGILRYQQVHRFESQIESALREARGTQTEPYMGHAEVWFDRSLSRRGPEVEAAGQRAVEDESKFIDFRRSSIWTGKEHVFVDHI